MDERHRHATHDGHAHHEHDSRPHDGHAHGSRGQAPGAGGHDHASHASERLLGLSALITGLFMVAEVAGGLVSGSLALLADAGHMLTDFAALSLGWFAFRLARRPADWKRSYGYGRFQILVAFANGLTLFFIAAWIVVEAWQRLEDPAPIDGGVLTIVAALGLAVNVLVFWLLHGADRSSLNVRGAALHVLGDLLGSVAALAAGITIALTGWTPVDPILSVLIALIILKSAWGVVAESGHILLEGTPPALDTRALGPAIVREVDGVEDVHHLHVWSLTEAKPMVTLHARLNERADGPQAVRAIKTLLADRFGLGHATVEVEYGNCADRAGGRGVG